MTSYVILAVETDPEIGVHFIEVGEYDGANAEAAVGKYLDEHPIADDKKPEFKAIPSSNFNDVKVDIEQPPPKVTITATARKPKAPRNVADEPLPGFAGATVAEK